MSYWGDRVRQVIGAWGTIDSIKAQSYSGLIAGGEKSNLWMPVTSGLVCSCKRQDENVFEKMCVSCYGIGLIGGYQKYGHTYLYISSIDPTLVLTNISLNQNYRPYRLILNDGQLTGTIETVDYTIQNTLLNPYEWDVKTYIKDTGGAVLVEYSTDSGVTWYTLQQPVTATTKIRFRITLSRTVTTIRSPFFEMLRFRWMNVLDDTVYISKARTPIDYKRMKYGLTETAAGPRFWTIIDQAIPSLSFTTFLEGPNQGQTMALFDFNVTFFQGIALRQVFSGRIITEGVEIYTQVF